MALPPSEVANRQAAKELTRVSNASASAMQKHVGRDMDRLMQIAATKGEKAALADLRRSTRAASATFRKTISPSTIKRTVGNIFTSVSRASDISFVGAVRRAAGTAIRKLELIGRSTGLPIGKAGTQWQRELTGKLRAWGSNDVASLERKLSSVLKSAAKQGARARAKGEKPSRAALNKLTARGRDIVTKQTQISRRRAINTAVDRAGSLRAASASSRAKQIGDESYIWTTVGDDRVRDEHAAREGKKFKFSQPPEDGNPGEPPNCRCIAAPVIDLS